MERSLLSQPERHSLNLIFNVLSPSGSVSFSRQGAVDVSVAASQLSGILSSRGRPVLLPSLFGCCGPESAFALLIAPW